MDSSAIAKHYFGSVKNNKIAADILIKIPKLVSVGNWANVEVIGCIDYMHDVPAVHYHGLMVNYQSGLYYLPQKIVEEIGKIDKRFLKCHSSITVA